MNPNKDKFINNLKTGLPALNVIKPSIGGSVASLALNKMAPTQNPSATSPAKTNYITGLPSFPAKTNYIKQVQQYNSPAGPQLPQANPTKPLVGNTSGISQVKSLSTPSAQSPSELYKAQLAVDQFNAAKNRGMEGINQKVIPLEFQTGQKSALERDSAFTGTELETRLARLQAKDEADRKAKQQAFENNLALRKFNASQQTIKPPTATQSTVGGYAQRLEQASNIFNSLEDKVKEYSTAGYAIRKALPNFLEPAVIQQQQQAEKNFLNAVLRRESGAVISPSEFKEGASQYFPQPGDSQQVLEQKKSNRNLVMNNFFKAAGPAYSPIGNNETGIIIAPDGQEIEIID
jgi:hypothetical protein